jgi:curved DNA-binding protein CbpA
VPPAASAEEIRRAYHRLARSLHPDRHVGSSPERAASAARRMQEVNAAWTVLSNQASRALYDADLRLEAARTATAAAAPRPAASSPTGAYGPAPTVTRVHPEYVDVAPPAVWSPVFRGMPWLLVLAVLGFIFVFTAFAAGRGDDEQGNARPTTTTAAPRPPQAGDCVRFVGGNGLQLVGCDFAHDAVLVELAPLGRPCPSGTREIYLSDERVTACLDVGR